VEWSNNQLMASSEACQGRLLRTAMNGYEQPCRTRAGGNTPAFCHLLQMRSLDTLVYQA
jgi:hypothetical protein